MWRRTRPRATANEHRTSTMTGHVVGERAMRLLALARRRAAIAAVCTSSRASTTDRSLGALPRALAIAARPRLHPALVAAGSATRAFETSSRGFAATAGPSPSAPAASARADARDRLEPCPPLPRASLPGAALHASPPSRAAAGESVARGAPNDEHEDGDDSDVGDFPTGVLGALNELPSDQGAGADRSLPVYTVEGVPTGETVTLPGGVFDVPLRVDVVHRVVVWQRNKRRAGTHKTKTRAEVKGTTRKARAQKGGGRARVGDLRAPQMRGGGVAHGPVLRSFETGLQRKVRKLGLKIALSAKAAEGRIAVLDSLHEGVEPKTRWLDGALDKLLGGGALAAGERQHSVLCAEVPPTEEEGALAGRRRCLRSADMVLAWESNAKRASKNLPHVQVMDQFGLNVYDILKHRSLVITKDALEALVKRVEEPIRR